MPKSHGRQSGGVGQRVHRRDEVGVAGHPQPVLLDRLDVGRPGVDRPDLDARHLGEVRGVQAADRAAAEHRHPDGRVAGHDPATSARQRGAHLRVATADAETSDDAALHHDRHTARGGEERRRGQGRQGARCLAVRVGQVTARDPEARRCGRGRQRDVHSPGDAVVHPVLLDRVTAAVDDRDRHPEPATLGGRDHAVAEGDRPGQLVLLARGRRGLHPEAVLGGDHEVAEARLPAGPVVAVLADVGDVEGVGDEEVLRVGRLPLGADHLRRDPLREERAHRGSRRGDPRHDDAVAQHRHAAGTGEHRLRRGRGEAGRDRRREAGHPAQVLAARDLLGGRDPRLRPRAGHAARPAVVQPGRRDQGAAGPHDGQTAAESELLGLVDGPGDQGTGLGQGEVARVIWAHAPTML